MTVLKNVNPVFAEKDSNIAKLKGRFIVRGANNYVINSPLQFRVKAIIGLVS